MAVHETACIEDSTVADAEIREYATIHDSAIGAGSRIYERASIKKSEIDGPVDVNAGAYVENAEIGERVQIGPNATIAGVTHELDEEGMTFRDDVFETAVVEDGAFVGAGAVVLPGVRIGEDRSSGQTPPSARTSPRRRSTSTTQRPPGDLSPSSPAGSGGRYGHVQPAEVGLRRRSRGAGTSRATRIGSRR